MATTDLKQAFLKTPDPLQPYADPVDYEALQRSIAETAAQTRGVIGPSGQVGQFGLPRQVKTTVRRLTKPPFGYEPIPGQRFAAEAAIQDYRRSITETQQTAEKSAKALELMGAATTTALKGLGMARQQMAGAAGRVAEYWSQATKAADEAVQASRERTSAMLMRLDDIAEGIGARREFAKAHAAQATVQGILGSMEDEGRQIAQSYGRDSKEYEQFTARKGQALAMAQSNLEASYQQVAEETGRSVLAATTTAMPTAMTLENYQEKLRTDTMAAMAGYRSEFEIQSAQFMLNIEQLSLAGLENIANWLIQTPTYSVSMTPLLNTITEIYAARNAQRQQNKMMSAVMAMASAPRAAAPSKSAAPSGE